MIFYVLEDLPQFTIKILILMISGQTFTFMICLSLAIQLFGLFNSIFKIRKIQNAEGIMNINNLQFGWAIFLWVYFAVLLTIIIVLFFHPYDNRPDWVKELIKTTVEKDFWEINFNF